MTKQDFQKLAENHILLLDGATGSNLMKAGMPRGVCTESWVIEHKNVIQALQKGTLKPEAILSMRRLSAETVSAFLYMVWRIRLKRSTILWPAIPKRSLLQVFTLQVILPQQVR